MWRSSALLLVASFASLAQGDAYSTMIQRYEAQIKKQERQLRSLRKDLIEKEQEAKRWQRRAETAKEEWTEAGESVSRAREQVKIQQQRRTRSHALAEEAQWSVLEQTSLSQAADSEIAFWTRELYKRRMTPRFFVDLQSASYGSQAMIEHLASLSEETHDKAEKVQAREAALRAEEFRWQNEEQKQLVALDRHRQEQRMIWLRWQEAMQKRQTLEDERSQMEQSAQALRVMLTELREHRNQTVSTRLGTSRSNPAARALKGNLPWPATGRVTQNFGKSYSDQLQQLVVSNGIRVETEIGKPVRSIQAGKVLFARPFQQYGQLVIIRHQHGLTSVYGELGETQVKEGDLLSTLDAVGTVGEGKSFYFELRQDEAPINPLAWLAPRNLSEVSSRRKYP